MTSLKGEGYIFSRSVNVGNMIDRNEFSDGCISFEQLLNSFLSCNDYLDVIAVYRLFKVNKPTVSLPVKS